MRSLKEMIENLQPKGELATRYHKQILASFSEDLACPFEGVLESPVLTGYRNKNQLSVGRDVDGNKGFGFVLGSWGAVGGVIGVSDRFPDSTLWGIC
jgi:tRNA (uracil-5-)-methyltransferase